jgi:hypothetical protein
MRKKTQKTYTTADYKVKQGRFLILSTISGDKYTRVAVDIVDETDDACEIAVGIRGSCSHLKGSDRYWIHAGFIILNSGDFRECAAVLFVKTREEANESLTHFLTDLNAY